MRLKKNETIAKFRDEFLAEKSDDYKSKFDQKNQEQQYIAIMNWKRKAKALSNATGDLAKVTMANVIAHLKNAHKSLANLTELSPNQAIKVQALLDNVKDTIDNFDRIKKQQLLATLQKKKESLVKEGDDLNRQIEALQNELK